MLETLLPPLAQGTAAPQWYAPSFSQVATLSSLCYAVSPYDHWRVIFGGLYLLHQLLLVYGEWIVFASDVVHDAARNKIGQPSPSARRGRNASASGARSIVGRATPDDEELDLPDDGDGQQEAKEEKQAARTTRRSFARLGAKLDKLPPTGADSVPPRTGSRLQGKAESSKQSSGAQQLVECILRMAQRALPHQSMHIR